MDKLPQDHEPTRESLDTKIEQLFTDLKKFPSDVAGRNPRQGMESDAFDRYWLKPDYETPTSSEALSSGEEMTITYSDLENDDPENVVKLQYPVPGGGTVDDENRFRSRLTTVIARGEEGMTMTTVETLINAEGPGATEHNRWVNDPEDVARLRGFIDGAPDRLVTEKPLSAWEQARGLAIARAVIGGMQNILFGKNHRN